MKKLKAGECKGWAESVVVVEYNHRKLETKVSNAPGECRTWRVKLLESVAPEQCNM